MPTPFVPVLEPAPYPRPDDLTPMDPLPRTARDPVPFVPRPFVVEPDGGLPAPTAAGHLRGHVLARTYPAPGSEPAALAAVAEARHPALAPLAEYLADPRVTDVFVNGGAGLWVDRGSGAQRDPLWQADEESARDLAVALIAAGGRHLDDACPCVDLRLDGGIRVHAVLPPVSTSGPLVSVRIPRMQRPRLARLAAAGMLDDAASEWLAGLVARRANILITGAAGSGKTTLLAALLAAAALHERIVTIEDVAELHIDHPQHVSLEARQANLEGVGEIGLMRLVREALRMRPDRIVLGECRGAEVRELLSALNTGHDGGAGTLHANGLGDVPARLEALGALAGLDDHALARQAVSAIGVVLHVERDRDGTRRLATAGRLVLDEGRLAVREETPWRA